MHALRNKESGTAMGLRMLSICPVLKINSSHQILTKNAMAGWYFLGDNVKAECEDWGFDFACCAHRKKLGETPEMLLLSEGCDQMRSIQWMMNSGFKFGNIRA
mmetsp:Transcript_3027/g.5725  ORF Transcript_3027/g.5725 Transcript_3027/m.5725 type:complete len:103 (-) Transcript_3027:27-335(-)